MGSIEFHKNEIESAVASAIQNGYDVVIDVDSCCYGAQLEIWERGNYARTVRVIDLHE